MTVVFNTQKTPVEESGVEIAKRIRAKEEKKEAKMQAHAIDKLLEEGKVQKITNFLPVVNQGGHDEWTESILGRKRKKKFYLETKTKTNTKKKTLKKFSK